MTIKRPIKNQTQVSATTESVPPTEGGAAIADRFKLDLQNPPSVASQKPGISTTIAMVAGLIALAAVGVLTFVIYQHWDFLKGA